jgi:ATP-dependent DNA helicase RecG
VSLGTPLRAVVGDKTAKVLETSLSLRTTGDLVHHYPRRYAERGHLTPLAALRVNDVVTVMAEVVKTNVRPMRQRRGQLFEVVVGDAYGKTLALTFFNQPWRERELKPGRQALFAGKVGEFRGKRQLNNPDYVLLDGDDASDVVGDFAGRLIPVYRASEKMPSWKVAQCVRIVLDSLDRLPDPLPDGLREARGLVPLDTAIRDIHRPASQADLDAARLRLKWDEAYVLQVALAQRRRLARLTPTPSRVRTDGGLVDAFEAALPFTLTAGQQEVAAQLDDDLAGAHPMHRLLQGEVGSGKTVVALRAMLTVVDAGGQAALMAPTEVLATQHARGIRDLLGPIGMAGELGAAEVATRVVLLTGSTPAAARREALAALVSGEAGIVIGTHALLEPDVNFKDLGLVVVDEQHRFGVEQRDVLRAKGSQPPHVLVMTATPIPRTVAMTVYGDLETSTLTELPRGRSPIATHVVPPEKPAYLDRAWTKVREEVAAGRQAFVVCPRIGEAEGDDGLEDVPDDEERRPPLAVLDVFPMLRDGALAGLRVEMLHGRLPSDAKDAVMRRFAAGDVDVLVATTVIEVGVDVPNATVMVVMDAERFGISQLHQLRGRVGRGAYAATCLLVTEAPEGAPSRERVEAVAATLDGFELAELDLRQRREGDVLGATQAGRQSRLRLLELLADKHLIIEARQEATALVEADPDLDGYPALRATLAEMLDAERAEYLEKG